MRFTKGHGTENDFVVLPDPDGVLDLTPSRVAALCDRRRGLGADGVLRVVRWKSLQGVGAPEPGIDWFMDYRNSDGSIAEMCGNGVRVFARYLAAAGLVEPGSFAIGTRAGVRTVAFVEDEIAAGMGPVTVGGAATATIGGRSFPGVAVDVGNPHLVCVTAEPIADLDLTRPPGHDPGLFPHGVNVEFVTPLADGAIALRVHERGVGETRSCGTGVVAAVAASLHLAGRDRGTVAVTTPGGRLRVDIGDAGAVLRGPAVLVAEGELSEQWWRAHA
ncbi:MAG: diaminopimelate epimerase [Pseudonocardia sp.]|nr:diaminopimelate epimerase [Pseudonocardia sp.]